MTASFGQRHRCLRRPLVRSYFTRVKDATTGETVALLNNGFVWGAAVHGDIGGAGSRAYLRREVIVWDDCVKLFYGESQQDNPWLWAHMAKYTEDAARLFHE